MLMGYIDISATYLDMVNSVPGPYKGTFIGS
ncbi:unknown [Bacteroides intestinalis CAG:315]|nr:unknown [Bacteroides intestinalis CAG:315]